MTSHSDAPGTNEDDPSHASEVRDIDLEGWPPGYVYAATRYADLILKYAFPERFQDLANALEAFAPTLDELRASGGGRTVFVRRFDESLAAMESDGGAAVWGKQNITIDKTISLDGQPLRRERVRGHEIDMFGKGSVDAAFPGIAVEMEWNNKDPFYDRDLLSFQALHHEGAIAVGVIVTRGPGLQQLIAPTIRSKDGGFKYGQSTTHWDKLLPRVKLGGGGACPLLLVGIEPERVDGITLAETVRQLLDEADSFKATWRESFPRWVDAKPEYERLRAQAHELMPPLKQVDDDDWRE